MPTDILAERSKNVIFYENRMFFWNFSAKHFGLFYHGNSLEIQVKTWHFCDNSNPPRNDGPDKNTPLINMLLERLQNAYAPDEEICIKETLVSVAV